MNSQSCKRVLVNSICTMQTHAIQEFISKKIIIIIILNREHSFKQVKVILLSLCYTWWVMMPY